MATEYNIIAGSTRATLIERINAAIQDNWKPLGGVAAVGDSLSSLGYVQAVTRETEEGGKIAQTGYIKPGYVGDGYITEEGEVANHDR